MPLYRNGQSVQYKPIGGPEGPATESVGTIRSVLTHPGSQANRNVNASEDQPRYEVSG
ncbi:hypothetical protein PHISCL_08317 [Aspergillus sclerotialis]|uniref:Hypervirulence associated protein TUDOR domain-containing protein n=1 Tax=Aspergillus sclerotialis TaxID=2070753 RepID=A0A3A2ZN96_9EURO|nr:hypothetical protein PHISCL_08317 [Aspergillus sclerotialis]